MTDKKLENAIGERSYQTGAINPLLAGLYRAHGVLPRETENIPLKLRAELCDDATNLIRDSKKSSECEMAADILLALLQKAESDLKQAIAERLSVMDNAPLRLILRFVNDDIAVADPVLRYSRALNDLDLLYIIQSKPAAFWRTIAARDDLGEFVIDMLAEKRDMPTSKTLAENRLITLTDYAAGILVDMAESDEELAMMMAERAEITETLTRRLYAIVGDRLKEAFPECCDNEEVDSVIDELSTPASAGMMPSAAMIKAADLFLKQGKLSTALMLNTLKRGQIPSFIAQFGIYTGVPVERVIAALRESDGEKLSVLCKGTGFSRADFLTIYGYSRGETGSGRATSGDVTRALSHYDRLNPELAAHLLLKEQASIH